MDINILFAVNFAGVFFAVAICGYVFVWPNIQGLAANRQLAICLAPQMFRLMALGLLHPLLSPDLAMEFAVPTVIVDVMVSLLAMLAVLLLHREHSLGRVTAAAALLLGSLHILISGYYAPAYNFPSHLNAQWLVPVMLGPIMLVSIILSLLVLLRASR